MAQARVVVLGAGFGGLEIASRLSAEFGESAEVVLVDRADGFVFGFSKLDVMFGRTTPEHVRHPYSDLAHPGVRFINTEVLAIDPVAKRVTLAEETLEADILVVALGADLDPAATPGLLEGGTEFYTVEGAFAAKAVLEQFAGGRVIVAVTSTPFKCPPAPSETALLMHDLLVEKGVRESSSVALFMPLPSPIPPSPEASKTILAAFAEREIEFHPGVLITSLDPARKVAIASDGAEFPYDLFLGVPKHVAPPVVIASGLAVDGWIPVNSLTLETSFPGVYAVGDVTSVGTPKAGVFSEGQAIIVAERIAAQLRGEAPEGDYDGHGTCYVELGHDMIAKVDVTFLKGQAPFGSLVGPSADLVEDKVEFGRARVARWFGRQWHQVDPSQS